jgi:predicted ATPase/DNA-binding CsgD family transcriptional regulator
VLVEPVGGPLRALSLQLRDRRLLVCLDNCEHLLEACAELAETVLVGCPEVSVLSTSREPLGVPGEIVWRVPSMAEDEAVTLFVDRASRVRPWFTLDDTSEAAVRTLCRRLDGIPLAIELAAAWLRTLTPAQIAAGLDDRFALLVRGPRGAMARQQTLVASIDWSHDLLDDTDRVVFRRLAVFAGGFTLDAARAVGAAGPVGEADVLVALGRLVDKSLVVMDDEGGEARYRLLETIRQYAQDRLDAAGETAAARDRHLDHFLALAVRAEPELVDADQDRWLARLEADHDNLRAAVEWGLAAPDPTRGRRLAAALLWLWYLRAHTNEGIDFLQRAIARAPEDRTPVQPTLHAGVAAVSVASGQFDLMLDSSLRGLELATAIGDQLNRARCLLLLGVAQSYLDFDAAGDLFVQADEAATAALADAPPALARFVSDRVVVMRGVLQAYRDHHDEARPLLQEGHERCLRRGDRGFAAMALDYQVVAAVLRGELDLAEELATRAYEIARPRADYYDVGVATSHLAFVKGFRGAVEDGLRLLDPVVRSVEGTPHRVYVPRLSQAMGRLSLLAGDFERSVAWYERDVPDTGPMVDSLIAARSLPGLACALGRLGRREEARARAERGLAAARKLDVPHLVADSLEQLAVLATDDDPRRAEDLHHEALALRVAHGSRLFQIDSLDALAGLAARSESFAEATRLRAAADAARGARGYPRPAIDGDEHARLEARLRDALGETAFAEARAEGAGLTLDEAVAYARRARGSRDRPSTGWASLTPTEIDVVRLVAEGLTNPEIGARLFVSRATVKTHLSHVYAKLGIANRTELATLASQQLDRG